MMLRKIVLFAVFLIVGCSRSIENRRVETLQATIDSLTSRELETLELFFRTLLAESQGGYVLYGNKPVCVEAFPFREEGTIFLAKPLHIFSTKLKEGALLWKKLDLNRYSKKYIFCVSEQPVFDKWVDLTFINTSEFLRTVESNSALFQYVLGPKATPSNLLVKLSDPKMTFHSVLKNDRVLIGLLLGYGTQNAILGSRSENIEEDAGTVPTLGFNSLAEEGSWLKEKEYLSINLSDEKAPLLPWFGCFEKKETGALIDGYKQAQKVISKTLHSKHFLQDVLCRLFETKITVNKSRFKSNTTQLPDKEKLTKLVAQSIWHCIDEEERDSEYIKSFCDGMVASEHGQIPLPENEYRELIIKFCKAKGTPSNFDWLATRKEVAYNAGLRVWDHFKAGKDMYSLSEIRNLINDAKSGAFKAPGHIDAEMDEELAHLHLLLYRRQERSTL